MNRFHQNHLGQNVAVKSQGSFEASDLRALVKTPTFWQKVRMWLLEEF